MMERQVARSLYAAIGLGVLGLVLFGAPGGLLLNLSAPVIRLVFGIPASEQIMVGEAGWPIVMETTVLWPLALVASTVGACLAGLRGLTGIMAILAGTALGAVLIAVLVYGAEVGWR